MFNNLIYTPEYHGIPLPSEYAPYIEQNLADVLVTIDQAMAHERWIVSACLDLRLPDYSGFLREPCTHHLALKFVKRMQHYARWKHTDLHDGIRQHKQPAVGGIWQKARADSGVPYYKVMLLLNHDAYYSQDTGYDPVSTLQFRAQLAWAKIIQTPKHHAGNNIRFPANWLLSVDTTADGLCQLFAKASALCAAPNDVHGQTHLSFGSTRHASRNRAAI